MLLTKTQEQELNEVRAEVKAIAGAESVKDAQALVDEVQQMMWVVDSASYTMRAAQGVGRMLQDIRNKVAEVRTMNELARQLKEN